MGILPGRPAALLTISACTPEAAAIMRDCEALALQEGEGPGTNATPREVSRSAYASGNELLCFYESADSGFRAASAFRQRVHDHGRVPIAFHVRMLLDCPGATDGTLAYAVKRKIVTARKLVRWLPAERIFATETGVQNLSDDVRNCFQPVEHTIFGSLPGEQLYCASSQQDACTRLSLAARKDDLTKLENTLHLRWRDNKLTVRPENVPITFGRGSEADIQLESDLTSRVHAQLSFQLTDFILADRSTNGTFVKIGDAEEVPLRHGQIVLRRSGVISLGSRIQAGGGNLIYFSVV